MDRRRVVMQQQQRFVVEPAWPRLQEDPIYCDTEEWHDKKQQQFLQKLTVVADDIVDSDTDDTDDEFDY